MFTEPMMMAGGASGGRVSVTLYAASQNSNVVDYFLDSDGTQLLDHYLGTDIDLTIRWIGGQNPGNAIYLRDSNNGYLLMQNVRRISVYDPNMVVRLVDLTALEAYANLGAVGNFSRYISDQGLRPGNTGADECVYSFPNLTGIRQFISSFSSDGFIYGAGYLGSPTAYSIIDFPLLTVWEQVNTTPLPTVSNSYGVVRMNFGSAVNFQNVYTETGGLPDVLILDFTDVGNYPAMNSGGSPVICILRQNTVAPPPNSFGSNWSFYVPDAMLSAYTHDSSWVARGLDSQIYPFSEFDLNDSRITI